MSTVLADDLAAGLGFVAERWQESLLRSRAARALVLCSRQVGKSTTVGYRALHTALYCPGRDVLVLSPTQRQSDELLHKIKATLRMVEGAPRLKRDNNERMELANGSRIISLPGSEGGIRGYSNVRLLLLDEASRIPDDVFVSSLPMVGSDGQIVALSTPWGRRGWFFDLHEDARNGWERHKVTVFESGRWDAARIEATRSSVGSFEWASDYLCEFGDTNSQFFSTEAIRAAVDDIEEWAI